MRLGWLGRRLRGTVCLGILSIQQAGWRLTAYVSIWKLGSGRKGTGREVGVKQGMNTDSNAGLQGERQGGNTASRMETNGICDYWEGVWSLAGVESNP